MTSVLRFRRTAEAVDSAASTAALENLDIVWLSPPGSLRSLKEMGWSSEGGGDESSVGPPRALPYDISTYGTTVYIACCGAFVGDTLTDVNIKDLFIGATAIEMIFSKMYAMGLSLRENAGVQATIVAIRALVKNASARDFADLSIEVGHLTAIDSSELQNTYMDFLTFAGDFGVGTVGCSAETLGVFEYTYMDRAKLGSRANGKPYSASVPQLAALFCEQTDLPDMRTLKSQAESHALAVGQGFRVTTWESGMHSLSKHGAIRLLDTKEMNWYTASPTTGAGIFKKRATAFISIFPVLSAGLRGITNPTSLMRLLVEVAEAFAIESTIPHVMAERVGKAIATLASSVSRRKEDEHGEEWAQRICQHKTDLRISGKSL